MPIEIESPEQMGYDAIKYNLSESSVTDGIVGDFKIDLSKLVLCYGHHLGLPKLRETLGKHYNVAPDSIIITTGAAGALFMVSTSLLEPAGHLVVVHPNYGTNFETPRAIGCEVSYIDLKFEEGFKLDIARLKKSVKSNTRLISITQPHNPTGVMLSDEDIKALVEIAEKNNCYLLVDETYRDLFLTKPTTFACSFSEKVISVSSLSKAYGLPGIRIGWAVCRDAVMMEKLLAAKEQINICNSVIDEEIAYNALLLHGTYLKAIQERNKRHFQIVKRWMEQEHRMEWVEPTGGVVCFPRIKEKVKVDLNKFYDLLLSKYSTYVGPGHWFEMKDSYMRIGYGWPNEADLEKGLQNISACITEATI